MSSPSPSSPISQTPQEKISNNNKAQSMTEEIPVETAGSSPDANHHENDKKTVEESSSPPQQQNSETQGKNSRTEQSSSVQRRNLYYTPERLHSEFPPEYFTHSESFWKSIAAQSGAPMDSEHVKHHEPLKTRFRFIPAAPRSKEHEDGSSPETIICIHGLVGNLRVWDLFACEMLNTRIREQEEENHFADDTESVKSEKLSDEQPHGDNLLHTSISRDDSYYSSRNLNDKEKNQENHSDHLGTHYNLLMYDNFNSGESSQVPQAVPQVYVQQLIELLKYLGLFGTGPGKYHTASSLSDTESDVSPKPAKSTLKKNHHHHHHSPRPLIVMGHSLGGAIALHFANQCPQKISKLVLCAPGGLLKSEPSVIKYAKMPILSSLIFGGMKRFLKSHDKMVERSFFGSQHADFLTKILDEIPIERTVHALRSVVNYFPIQGCEYLIEWLYSHQDHAPTHSQFEIMIAWGMYDQDAPVEEIFPPIEQQMRYMNTSFALFDNTRHGFIVERAEDFSKVVLNFLAGSSVIGIREELSKYEPDAKKSKKDRKLKEYLEEKFSSYIV